jgi:hypothetical protein
MLAVYVIGRGILRAALSSRLPLWWPIEIAVLMIVGFVMLAALYLTLAMLAVRWLWRTAHSV